MLTLSHVRSEYSDWQPGVSFFLRPLLCNDSRSNFHGDASTVSRDTSHSHNGAHDG